MKQHWKPYLKICSWFLIKKIWLDAEAFETRTSLPYDTKTPYLSNSEHWLSDLILKHLPTKWKHISAKQTLTELRRKIWLCRGRNFVLKALKNFCVENMKGHHFSIRSPFLWQNWDYLIVMHFIQPESIILARCR